MPLFSCDLRAKSLGKNIYNVLFVAFVALCGFAIICNSNAPLMSGDDITYYTALVNGESVWHGRDFSIKRFFPLAGWNLILVAHFTMNPYAFMVFNAFCFVVMAVCFYILTRDFSPKMRIICFVIFTFSVGCVKIYTQITFPDTTQIAFIMVFLTLTYALFSLHTNFALNLSVKNLKRGGGDAMV